MTTPALHDCRDRFAATLIDLAANDDRVVVVVNDSVGSSKLNGFAARFPERLINVGIAEQNMVGVAAGLAAAGRIPFVSAASPFLTARAMEQIKADVAYSDHHVVLCGMSPGLAYGALGATHHSIEDLAWMRALHNLTVVVPADPLETEQALRAAYDADGPVFVRVSRMPVPDIYPDDHRFVPGRATLLRPGTDVTIAATGTMVHRALEAAELLTGSGVDAQVLSVPTVQPLDEPAIISAARHTGAVVTVEEGGTRGGLGGAVAETLAQHHPVPMAILGVTDFAPTGGTGWLLEHFGLTTEGIAEAAARLAGSGPR